MWTLVLLLLYPLEWRMREQGDNTRLALDLSGPIEEEENERARGVLV